MAYDANGNMGSDMNKVPGTVIYKSLNLPGRIEKDGKQGTYTYAADGESYTINFELTAVESDGGQSAEYCESENEDADKANGFNVLSDGMMDFKHGKGM